MWLIPDDLEVDLPPPIEVKRYSRAAVASMVDTRRRGGDTLVGILRLLSEPVTPPSGLMLGQSLLFPSIISACYFDAKAKTERGERKLGLRKQSVGRYLDIIRCIAQSQFASDLPELTIGFITELLDAPYYFEMRGARGAVDPGGFYHHVFLKRKLQMYKRIAEIVEGIHHLSEAFIEDHRHRIMGFYGEAASKSNLLYRVLLSAPSSIYDMGELISVKGVVQYVIESFNLTPSQPIRSFRHDILNMDVVNSVTAGGYENDFAKRIIEVAVLKGALIPVSGVPIIRVLKSEPLRGGFERVPCQNFRLCTDEQFIKAFGGGR